ncbi:MAG: NAD(P)-dependent oxidoreductase [Pseudomonadota bacterium]
MAKISFLGLGAMGSRMAARLSDAGHDLTVWNRTRSKASKLEEQGARWAESPRVAAAGAELVISMVRDDEAAKQVWLDPDSGALRALEDGTVAIESSTLSIPFSKMLAGAVGAAGHTFYDAPVAGSRLQAETGALIFLVGGPAQGFEERVRPVLESMAAGIHHLGEAGSGTTVKLMVNSLFGTQLAVVAELIGMADRAGVSIGPALEAIGASPVCSPAVKGAAAAMAAGAWPAAFPIELVAKDFEHLARSAENLNAALPVSRSVGDVYSAGVSQGYGADNINGIVQLYRQERLAC